MEQKRQQQENEIQYLRRTLVLNKNKQSSTLGKLKDAMQCITSFRDEISALRKI